MSNSSIAVLFFLFIFIQPFLVHGPFDNPIALICFLLFLLAMSPVILWLLGVLLYLVMMPIIAVLSFLGIEIDSKDAGEPKKEWWEIEREKKIAEERFHSGQMSIEEEQDYIDKTFECHGDRFKIHRIWNDHLQQLRLNKDILEAFEAEKKCVKPKRLTKAQREAQELEESYLEDLRDLRAGK